MLIRAATIDDAPAIASIYNHHVEHGYATLDVEAVSVDDRRAWIGRFAPSGPHRLLVAEVEGSVLGYACSGPYRTHPAFAETVELSVYLAPDAVGQGVGSGLYGRLIAELEREPVHRALAGIALPNEASVRLHRRHGFTDVGVFDEYADKNGQRISSVWMERRFG